MMKEPIRAIYWRQVGEASFYGVPYGLYLSSDEQLWGYGNHGDKMTPNTFYQIGYFDGVHSDFARIAKPILEAAVLDAGPSVSPNARGSTVFPASRAEGSR